jgi:signal transduction histidine kinase/CheY-like chemotaxis protein
MTTLAKKRLRERAEDLLRRTRDEINQMPPEDITELVHELQVHQIELSVQNEGLRRAQEELEGSHQKYYDLYDFAPVGYLTLNKEGLIQEANLMAGTMFECTRSELSGRKFSSFIHPDSQDTYYLHYRKVFRAITQKSCELRVSGQSGCKIIQLHSLMIAHNDDCCRTAISDITAIKELEGKARSANNAKSEFLTNMSHEMRTPLNAIMGLAHILGKSHPLTKAQKDYIGTLRLSADSLLTLINELLDIAKIETGTIELEHIRFNLLDLLNEALTMMNIRAREKGVELVMESDPALHSYPAYYGDPARLRQIIVNLLSNAIKFTEKGKVTLRVKVASHSTERTNLTLAVIDNGIGIAKEKHASIFETFTQADASTTRKFGGTGLGLAICKQLVEHMNGKISVSSSEGKGSTFTVRLPLQISSETAQPKGKIVSALAPAYTNAEGKPHILLVEDHYANVLIATAYLDDLHYTYDIAATGTEALEKIKTNHYSIILMDVQMQDMDGFEATRCIRKIEHEQGIAATPIIAITAHALQGDKEKCLAAGMDDYIAKPFDPDELRSKLEQYLAVEMV